MGSVSSRLVRHAQQLAQEVAARALVVCSDALRADDDLRAILAEVDFPTILVLRARESAAPAGPEWHRWVPVPAVHMTRAGQIKAALLVCLARAMLRRGDRVVCLTGPDSAPFIDTVLVLTLGEDPELFCLLDAATLGGDVAPAVFERVLTLAGELATEGREGRPVGVLFVLGDSERVLAQSRSLILNPFRGYPEAERNLLDPGLAETIKEYAALDGAFVIRGDGVVLTAGTHLLPPPSPGTHLPGGLGTRHAAAAAITASTTALAVSVSQSTGAVAVFKSGQMVTDIHRLANGGGLTF